MKKIKFFNEEDIKSEDKVEKNVNEDKNVVKKMDQLFEDHMVGREEQIKFICDKLDLLKDDEIEYIYNHIEVKLENI